VYIWKTERHRRKTHGDDGDNMEKRIYAIKDFCDEKRPFLSETEKAYDFVLSWCGRRERKEKARDHWSFPAQKN